MSRRLHSADVPPIRGQSGVQFLGFGLSLHVMSSLGSAKVAKSDLEELLLCSSEDKQFASDGVCVHGA